MSAGQRSAKRSDLIRSIRDERWIAAVLFVEEVCETRVETRAEKLHNGRVSVFVTCAETKIGIAHAMALTEPEALTEVARLLWEVE